MLTSLNETRRIDQLLSGHLSAEESLLIEAEMTVDQGLARKVETQRTVLQLVRWYGRKQLKKEVLSVEQQLFEKPKYLDFRRRIFRLFH